MVYKQMSASVSVRHKAGGRVSTPLLTIGVLGLLVPVGLSRRDSLQHLVPDEVPLWQSAFSSSGTDYVEFPVCAARRAILPFNVVTPTSSY